MPRANLVLISRAPSIWMRLQANQQLGLLTWEDLRLTLEESVEIVRLRPDRDVPGETIRQVHAMVDGWAAGLILILQSLRQGIVSEKVDDFTREGIIQYFGKEISTDQPGDKGFSSDGFPAQ
jgi:ATP/maltotriose-dependent transcriptional regulator MalT